MFRKGNVALPILIIIFVFLVFFLGYAYRAYQFPRSKPAVSESAIKGANEFTDLADWRENLLSTQSFKGIELGAYFLENKRKNSVFVIAPTEMLTTGEYLYGDFLSSTYVSYFSTNNLFSVGSNKIWVINSQTNQLQAYDLQKVELSTESYYSFEFLYAVSLPNYELGNVYGIKCNSDTRCDVNTAFHQESGCELEFNPTTNKFSVPICHSIGGEFLPKAKKIIMPN